MFDQFKEKINSIQHDLNDGLKTLGEKAREVSRSKILPGELHILENKQASLSALKPEQVDAGEEILNRFQQSWAQVHVNIEFCAEQAGKVDRVVQELSDNHERELQTWKQLQARVIELPDMVKQIQTLAVTLGKLEASFEEVEGMLGVLEDTSEEEELLRNKKTQVAELTRYRELKHKERLIRRDRLQDEYNQNFRRIEEKEDAKKKERQKTFQEVFAADMDHYRTHGQTLKLVTETPTEQEGNLDEFEMSMNADDQLALDDFLGPDDGQETVPMATRDRVERRDEEDGRRAGEEDDNEVEVDTVVVMENEEVEEEENYDDDDEDSDEMDEEDEVSVYTATGTEDESRVDEGDCTQGDGRRRNKEEQGGEEEESVEDKVKAAITSEVQPSTGSAEEESPSKGEEQDKEEEEDEDDFGTPDEDADEETGKT